MNSLLYLITVILFGIFVEIIINVQTSSGNKVIFCQYNVSAIQRPDKYKVAPEDLKNTECTHIVALYGVLDVHNYVIIPADPSHEDTYKKLVATGKPVIISFAGWKDSGDKRDKYRKLLTYTKNRRKFADGIIAFLEKYGFKGLELSLMFPGCTHGHCGSRNRTKKRRRDYKKFAKRLHEKLSPKNYMLNVVVSADDHVRERGFTLHEWKDIIDYVIVFTVDYYGWWDKEAYPANLLYSKDNDLNDKCLAKTMKHLKEAFPAPEKLIPFVGLYGRTYQMKEKGDAIFGVAINGAGNAGPVSKEAGFLLFPEICSETKANAIKNDQCTTYYDKNEISQVGKYVFDENFSGISIHTIDMDDVHGTLCNCDKFPLTTTIIEMTNGLQRTAQQNADCVDKNVARKLIKSSNRV